MAKTFAKITELRERAQKGLVEARPIGGRVLLPGEYVFDTNPECRYETRTIAGSDWNLVSEAGSDRSYLQLEVQSNHGWVDVSTLMKRTKPEGASSLVYVNDWIQQFADVVELAAALAGHTLVVSRDRANTYSTYKEGQTVEPYINGVAYKAALLESTPAPASTANAQNTSEKK